MWDKLETDLIISGDIIDRLQLLGTFLRKDSFDSLLKTRRLIRFIDKLPEFKDDIYVKGAAKDFALHPKMQFVVYGHSHFARETLIESIKGEPAKRYVNTGTYQPLVQKAKRAGYSSAKRMTITIIYNSDEDNSKNNKKEETISLEFWNGLKQKEYDPIK